MIWFGLVLWHINHCRLFNAKSFLYVYIKYIWFGLVWFYSISTVVGYLMPNSFYAYILNIYDLVWFCGTSTVVGYLMPNTLYTYILNIYDLVWFCGISTIVGYLMLNPFYTYILNIYDLVWFGFIAYQPIVGYLMPNSFYAYRLNKRFLNPFLVDNIFKRSWAHFFTQLNGFTYFYPIRIILFSTNYLLSHSFMFSSISMYH